MPAELPALTVISREARTEVLAGAMRVSLATGCPSAEMATQEVWSARMRRVNLGGAFATAGGAGGFVTTTSVSGSGGAELAGAEFAIEDGALGDGVAFGEAVEGDGRFGAATGAADG
jgi:hypothetical protein